MANRYILLVSERGVGFTVNALTEALQKGQMETRNVSVADLNMHEYIQDAFLVIMVDMGIDSKYMRSISDWCEEAKKQVFLYGDRSGIDTMKSVFGKNPRCTEFARPVDTEKIVARAQRAFEASQNEGAPKKVLVVDDNGLMLRTVNGWLENKYDVSLANSVASAFRAIDKAIPDLILLDYEMPVCNGSQFMEMLSKDENYASIPVIFLTSRGDAQTVREVMQLKPKGYILKSTPQDQLIKTIDDYFAQN